MIEFAVEWIRTRAIRFSVTFRAGELAYKSDFADKQGCERAGQDA
jgi:hypothetical protein